MANFELFAEECVLPCTHNIASLAGEVVQVYEATTLEMFDFLKKQCVAVLGSSHLTTPFFPFI